MRILHVCSLEGDIANGMFQVIPEHVKAQSHYAEVILLNLGMYKFDLGEVCSFSVDDYRHNGFKGIIERIGKIDIVIFHGMFCIEIIKFWERYIWKKIPYIVIPHGGLTEKIQSKSRLKKQIYNLLVGHTFCSGAHAIQFLSEGEKGTSVKFKYKRCIVSPNGIHLPMERIHTEKRITDVIKVVYIGRYAIFHKGLDLFLEAVKEKIEFLKKENVRFFFYGDKSKDDYEEFVRLIEEYRLNDLIQCNGLVHGSDKEEVLLSADYFILTSRLEGMPMGLLEAMSFGIPVLLTESTNMGDVVREFRNGHVVETAARHIKQLFEFAVENKDRYDAMVEGSLHAAAKFEWSIVAGNAVDQYTNLLKESF